MYLIRYIVLVYTLITFQLNLLSYDKKIFENKLRVANMSTYHFTFEKQPLVLSKLRMDLPHQ